MMSRSTLRLTVEDRASAPTKSQVRVVPCDRLSPPESVLPDSGSGGGRFWEPILRRVLIGRGRTARLHLGARRTVRGAAGLRGGRDHSPVGVDGLSPTHPPPGKP